MPSLHGNFTQGNLGYIGTYLRYIDREEIFSPETAYVTTQSGKSVKCTYYALSFIRQYKDDAEWLRQRFGSDMDFETLQQEMLFSTWWAAQKFDQRDRSVLRETPDDFRKYLSYCLLVRLQELGERGHRSVVVESIENILEGKSLAQIREDAPERSELTVPDIADELEDVLDLPRFLARLSPQQRAIFNYKAEHTWGDGSLGEFLETQGISFHVMWFELKRMLKAYRAFREDNPNWEQMMAKRVYTKKKVNKNGYYTTKREPK